MVKKIYGKVYDWSLVTLVNGASDYDVKTEVAALFSNVPYAHGIALFHNKEIKIRFNSVLMPQITAGISRSPFQTPDNFLEISNLFLSNDSGSDCVVEILIW